MTKQKKRQPSNTITAQIGAMASAATPLPEIPAHLPVRDRDWPFLKAILRARLREEWSGPDLALAVELARIQADFIVESRQLELEGTVIAGGESGPKVNPRQKVVDGLSRRSMALMRSMKLAGDAAIGDKRDLSKARALQRQAEGIREGLEDEDLLA